jgi:enterochelin esterase-like enzyme
MKVFPLPHTLRTSIVFLLALFCIGLVLTGCQFVQSPVDVEDWLPAPAATVTFTPFQANSPTPKPTLTAAPEPTVTVIAPTLASPTMTVQVCTESEGQVERHEVAFTADSPKMGFRVYLPPCFEQAKEAQYPVLYMIHGQTFNDDQWERLGIVEAADALIAEKTAPPFIIVMPHERNTFADIYETPFRSGIVDGLVPWIDSHYPTCVQRSCRAIGGLSRGGAWALHFGFSRWDLFGAIGMHSTPPFIGDPNRLPGWLREIPPDQLPRIYMDTGRHDYFIRSTSELEAQLMQLQVPHEWYLFNGTHNEEYWSAHVTDYLKWYTQPWQPIR